MPPGHESILRARCSCAHKHAKPAGPQIIPAQQQHRRHQYTWCRVGHHELPAWLSMLWQLAPELCPCADATKETGREQWNWRAANRNRLYPTWHVSSSFQLIAARCVPIFAEALKARSKLKAFQCCAIDFPPLSSKEACASMLAFHICPKNAC